ncbi:helix-turn-helix domain-containing protein [Actinoplanes sp. NPDC051475]|uniref:TetR/AcrR family transcriptional regulator n=1 Tax=Actinoplanes sp. NPDC051475 TaxID=3157225 RepID=UPI00344EADB8
MNEAATRRDTIAARRAGRGADERARRREQIVHAAVRAIEEHGSGAGLGAVADQAGLPRPHVYRHFASKDDLDQEVARFAARLLSAWIRPALTASGTPPKVVHGIIGRVLEWAVDHPNLYRFRARLGQFAAVPELSRAGVAYLRAAGYDMRPPAHVVAGVIGMVDASILWWLDHPEEMDIAALTDRLAAQVWLILADLLDHIGRPLDPANELTPVDDAGR